jgi:hypothetical protein
MGPDRVYKAVEDEAGILRRVRSYAKAKLFPLRNPNMFTAVMLWRGKEAPIRGHGLMRYCKMRHLPSI